MSGRIGSIATYRATHNRLEDTSGQGDDGHFTDIKSDLELSFNGHFISFREEEQFTSHYTDAANEVYSLLRWLETFKVEAPDAIDKLAYDFENIPSLVQRHNELVIQNTLDTHKNFFDHCLNYPLDRQQRRSIVSEADNCLVVSSAGSGKTSSIIGKVKYLIDIKKTDPKSILLISYTNKAAAELTERMGIEGLRGYTFHKLAIDIIGRATGQKPSIYENTDSLFIRIFHELLCEKKFKKSIIEYFVDYQAQETESEQRKSERRKMLSEQKDTRLRALLPDMDGNTVYVRSK